MIRKIEICNFKSIPKLELSLGRINVFIGANGSGKSNILEAVTIGSAAANDKLDNEFLASRGIRVSDDPRYMRSAFEKQMVDEDISLTYMDDGEDRYTYTLQKDNERPYSPWARKDGIANTRFRPNFMLSDIPDREIYLEMLRSGIPQQPSREQPSTKNDAAELLERQISDLEEFFRTTFGGPADLRGFLVYSPENSALRIFEKEGQIQPLGIRGEGLFKLLKVMSEKDKTGFEEIKKRLLCIDWFSDFEIARDLSSSERSLRIRDRYLDDDLAYFDQKSANEGFLFILFYLALFISQDTPPFFAVDNVDASLNPKLCSQLIMELVQLAEAKGKQVLFTTHNPAILDGLDLTDEEQRLFVVSRNRQGHTQVKRVPAPKFAPEQPPVRLSEAFLRGYLGGLPDNF